jgi:predicted RNase H-like HicB family nuclease
VRDYLVIYEQGPTSWGAYVPDLPGCVAVGDTRQEVETLIAGAIRMHIEGMKEDGVPIPEPTSDAGRVAVAA